MGETEAQARTAALRLLAAREHGAEELARKLRQKGHPADAAEQAVAALQVEGLLSEERFVEAFVRSRLERGSGPLRIRAELGRRGIGEMLTVSHLDLPHAQWCELAEAARRKRFGADRPHESREWARQARFLEYRGFTAEQIRSVLNPED